jgi:hypothetical protein
MDSPSRNGHRSDIGQTRAVVQAKPVTAYEAALATATDAEKQRLQALRLQFDIPPNSPEWQFYAIMAGSRTDKTLEAIVERLERVEQGVDDLKVAKAPPALPSDLGAQLGRIETRLQGLKTARSTFGFLVYVAFFLAGACTIEFLLYVMLGARVPGTGELVAAGVIGAGVVVIALLLTAKVQQVFEDRRLR